MAHQRKRVLIAPGYYDYRLHRGIERYAQEHGWHLSSELTREKVIPWGWNGDGILAWLGAGDDLAEFVVQARKPTVDFSYRRPHLKFPHVLADHAHGSQLVAEHFLSRGFTNFIFYSDVPNWSYEERGKTFVEIIQRAGHHCTWLKWHESAAFFPAGRLEEWKRKRKWLTAELKQFAKPLAVFAPNDGLAIDVMETCESAKLAVPDQVAICGADNYLLAPETMHTPLSTVDTNFEAMGYRGAQLLDEMMRGQPAPKHIIRVPSAGVIVRKSTDLLAVNHPGVARSLRFILDHCHEPISIKNLVGVAAMSRRGLHTAFVENIGRTPGEELSRARIGRAKKLLAESDHKMEVLARMCGYQSANSFWVAFRQATGMTPRQYREKLLIKG
jgi:LacI family transcriptional regulator